jgi:AcrR family transcriptional regulator
MTRQKQQVDERIRRTRARLGSALVALIHEKPFNDVTVQDVLDRASVGRSIFYLHFRNKMTCCSVSLRCFWTR